MKTIFVDTFYWIALINKTDSWHLPVKNYSYNLKNIQLVTTEEVLTETINFFCFFSSSHEKGCFSISKSNY